MNFEQRLNTIPYTPSGTQTTGFLAPLTRAYGHLLFTLAALSTEEEILTDDELLTEIQHAQGHWHDATSRADLPHISTSTRSRLEDIAEAIGLLIIEWPEWEVENRRVNTRALANRIVGFTTDLDREFLGIASNPGTAL